uniref:GRF-type domain-containing protein n=1 Tax=Chromera velia CCMP2878 TaxID=1169474 RepID=A0A0G4G0K5_9ALVE|eukprot:Cvel_19652.t1-p1 / transcript=Cvel_19652.t1 / gene=Cvel_19652 / organism=Chromera_velia_CCMP2878 / gene_product=hypothetical protein / transcript_product=hypothetical protein / location=Cvel_scaffold1712:37574-39286(-) / protein_length=571 / sequence_SO=supercontig / SO=protein_coding / is_pseudo=false
MSRPLCNCKRPQECVRLLTKKEGPNKGRYFFKCQTSQDHFFGKTDDPGCNKFIWEDEYQQETQLGQAGNRCNCGMPSRLVQGVYRCAGGHCEFALAQTPQRMSRFPSIMASPPAASSASAPAQPSSSHPRSSAAGSSSRVSADTKRYLDYVVDEPSKRALQELLSVSDRHVDELGTGRDVEGDRAPYDQLELRLAFRIVNDGRKEKYERLRDSTKQKLAQSGQGEQETAVRTVEAHFPREYRKGMKHLFQSSCAPIPLDRGANEVLLLHGTKPEYVHGILFDGLKGNLARHGLFGRGVYLSCHGAKIDQYTTEDTQPSRDENGLLSRPSSRDPLHKLYDRLYSADQAGDPDSDLVRRPFGDLCYALVCRVALGKPVKTQDGETKKGTQHRLFKNGQRNKLAFSGRHTVLAETGGIIRRFPEFVVFNNDAILVEYLLVFERVRTLCDCGLETDRRTVGKSTLNFGRPILCKTCEPHSRSCNFPLMLPQCKCGRAANIQFSQGEWRYKCSNYRFSCGFDRKVNDFQWGPAFLERVEAGGIEGAETQTASHAALSSVLALSTPIARRPTKRRKV